MAELLIIFSKKWYIPMVITLAGPSGPWSNNVQFREYATGTLDLRRALAQSWPR